MCALRDSQLCNQTDETGGPLSNERPLVSCVAIEFGASKVTSTATPRNQRNTHDKQPRAGRRSGRRPTDVLVTVRKKRGPDHPALDLGERADNAFPLESGYEESADPPLRGDIADCLPLG